MSFDLTLDGLVHFGKHKGRKVRDVLANDPGWLAWFRDAKLKSGDGPGMSRELLRELGDKINEQPSLRKKFAPHVVTPSFSANMKSVSDDEAKSRAYQSDWGAW